MKIVIKKDSELFNNLNTAFADFQEKNENLFFVDISNDELNSVFKKHVKKTPIFRKSFEWDCSCCRHSIRDIAKVVTIQDNKKIPFLQYVLDKYDLKSNYSFLHEMFLDYIDMARLANIKGLFYYRYPVIGVKQSLESSSGFIFHHVYFNVALKYQRIKQDENNNFLGLKATVTKYYPYTNILKDVLFYIKEGFIYRGTEKQKLIEDTIDLLTNKFSIKYNVDLFVWENIFSRVANFNNDVISTLVDDLIKDNRNVEKAIDSYNKKVSPINYRQPKATIISPSQIKQCELDLKRLGYDNFVENFSFANPSDISILDILWTSRKVSGGRLSDLLVDNVKQPTVNDKNVTKITFGDFIELLKTTKNIEIDSSVLEKVVLIKDNFPKPVFAWDNHINFCYQTGLADVNDMISKKVKNKGGVIDAELRFSLYWENLDDLDLHLEDKSANCHIYWNHKHDPYISFKLDVDMNVEFPVAGAVENIFTKRIESKDIAREFLVYVNNFKKRERSQKCLLNVYHNNKIIKQYMFKNPPDDNKIKLFKFKIDKEKNIIFTWSNKQAERKVQHETKFVKVDTVLLSPNYWLENGKGNKHIFFLKKGEPIKLTNIRPYNIEQLLPELVKHRKVLQLLSKRIELKGKPQLTGWGISFGKKREFIIKVNGRPYKLVIDPTYELQKSNVKQLKVANV